MVDETNKKFDKDEEVVPQMEDDTVEADDDSAYDDDISDDDYDGDDDLDETDDDDDFDVSDDESSTPLVKKLYASAKGEDEDDDDDDWWKDGGDYSSKQREELEQLYSGTLRQFNENEIVSGTVVSIGDKEVVLNIGFKSEGVVPISEFRSRDNALKIGDKVEVFIESVEDQDGQLILSRKRAKNLRSWEMINDSMDNDTIIMGHVMRRTKGGFVVDVNGIEAFLPGSQIDVKPVRDFDVYVGRSMEFKVVKINHAYENVVVSHKILIEAKLEEQRKEILEKLEKGQVLEGTVKNMTNFGVFIDLGGVDGLLHITDISWGRINHPEEVLELDQKVNVVVLEFDDAKKRISLGMKQLTAHPWESLPETLVEGSVVKGKIVTVAEYGVFLEILPGVEGLIHTSEMSWSQHSKNPTEMFRPGEELEAVVLSIDRDDRKMSLGLKQLLNDPWADIETRYPVGSQHTGLVRNMTNYGLFVELQEGVDGLVHISDLSWTKKFSHPSEYTKVDDQLEVVVLDIDKENRRLSLGHKQLTEDVWDTFAAIFTVGSVHSGTIKKIQTKGATVELDYGVEGIVPPKHLSVEDGKEALKVDDAAEFVVIEFHKDAKRLILSHTRAWKEEEAPAAEQPKSNGNATKGQGRTKATPAQQTAKAGTTTLGELDVLAKLKEQMEAEEQKGTKKKSSKKKEEAPVEEVEEEVDVIMTEEPEIDAADSDDESDE
ncbi:MAG: 30S ribosomal protein S1 [Bacteroidia bacterium]